MTITREQIADHLRELAEREVDPLDVGVLYMAADLIDDDIEDVGPAQFSDAIDQRQAQRERDEAALERDPPPPELNKFEVGPELDKPWSLTDGGAHGLSPLIAGMMAEDGEREQIEFCDGYSLGVYHARSGKSMEVYDTTLPYRRGYNAGYDNASAS